VHLTPAQLARLAQENAENIWSFWIGEVRGKPRDDTNPVIRLAMDWLQSMSSQQHTSCWYTANKPLVVLQEIPRPICAVRARSSEAYFVVWAHTEVGKEEESEKRRFFRGLAYDETLSTYEMPRFLRKLLTEGTRLHAHPLKYRYSGLDMLEMMAIGALRQREGSFTEQTMRRIVRVSFVRPRVPYHEWEVWQKIREILQAEKVHFDNSFQIVGQGKSGQPVYFLPPGQENLIHRDKIYDLGPVAYFDGPTHPRNPFAPTGLPLDLQAAVLRHLFIL
jgi:hypothetical protein